MDANTYSEDNVLAQRTRARGRALPRREPQRRVDPARAHAAGRPRLGPAHVGDQLLHALDRLLPGQYRLHVLSEPFRVPRRARSPFTIFGPDPVGLGWSDSPHAESRRPGIPPAGRDREDDLARRPLLRACRRRLQLFQPHRGLRGHDGIRDSGTTYYDVEPGTTDNSFYHSKNDQITEQYAAFGEIGYSPNDRWTFTGGLRWFDHTRTRDYFTQQPNGRESSGLFEEGGEFDQRHHEKTVRPVQAQRATRWCTRCFSDGFRAGGRNVTRPGVGAAGRLRPGFPRQLRARLQEPLGRRPYTFNLTAFKMEWKDYQVEVVDPGEAALYASWSPTSATPRSRVSAPTSARTSGIRSIFGLNLQLLDPKMTRERGLLEYRKRRATAILAEGKRRRWLEYTLPRGDRGRPFLRPLTSGPTTATR